MHHKPRHSRRWDWLRALGRLAAPLAAIGALLRIVLDLKDFGGKK